MQALCEHPSPGIAFTHAHRHAQQPRMQQHSILPRTGCTAFRASSRSCDPKNRWISCASSTDEGPSTAEADGTATQQSPAPSSNREPDSLHKLPLALGAVALGAALFLGARSGTGAVSFDVLQAESVPMTVALSNQRPTVLEFYANWCEVCRELLPDTAEVQRGYKDKINFVMLNVDNTKWAPEMAEYGVQGIPQYVFLDSNGAVQASAAGRVPRQVLEQNMDALSKGQPLPWARVRETASALQSSAQRQAIAPRTHG